jgi:flagellar protein FlbD
MITLHRLGHKLEVFHLNPDLIFTVEATPDTVITLTTGVKIVVAETPQRVATEVKAYRIDILAAALTRRREHRVAPAPATPRATGHLTAVENAPSA